VLYELHIGTFSREGTFLGAIGHLDHLAALGVTMIELMPVGTFPGSRNWGYDGVLPYAPHHDYGRPDDLKRLVDECHRRCMSVVLDVVYNHFGPASNSIAEYAPDFFTGRHHTPWGGAIDFDGPHARPVREYFIQNAIYWVEQFHMDGLRLDAVQAVFDDSPEHILDELARRVRDATPGRLVHLTLENDNNDARWLSQAQGAKYEAQWNDDFHHVMRVLVAQRRDGYYVDYTDAPLRRLGLALTEGFSYQGEASKHRPGLHRGTPSAQLPPTAFINFLQNHDQVGNTPFGQRLTALAPAAAVRLGTAILLLAPGIPMLFMGQEWGSAQPFDFFCDYPPPLADLVRNGRREEFSHLPEFSNPETLQRLADPNAPATRDGSVLDWVALDAPVHAAWLAFHRELLEVRRDAVVPLLERMEGSAGSFRILDTTDALGAGALEAAWETTDGRRLLMTANLSDGLVAWRKPPGQRLFSLPVEATGAGLPAWGLVLTLQQPA
jgi:maltooligosyltrehalose trehalohydrolase